MITKKYFKVTPHLFILIFAIFWMSIATAQEATPTPPDPDTVGYSLDPKRESGTNRIAPEREPQLLSCVELANGQVERTVLLPVTADSYIASARPNQNFGGDSLFLGYGLTGQNNYAAERLLVQFDTTSIPTTADIQSATFRLYLILSVPANDEPMGTVLRRLASPWTEYGVTWNSEPQ